jgi:hypothetical protein
MLKIDLKDSSVSWINLALDRKQWKATLKAADNHAQQGRISLLVSQEELCAKDVILMTGK